MSTRLIEDRRARATALRGMREVLAALKEAAATPPPDAVTYPEAVPWDTPAHSTPAADMAALVEAMQAGSALVIPQAPTVRYAGPTPAMWQLLHRLVDLLGLSDLEREFFTAGGSREVPDAWDGLAAYADWLEDRGNDAGAARVRKLTPAPGDLLVLRCEDRAAAHAARVAETLAAELASRGCPVTCAVLPAHAALSALSEEQMATLGWVPAGRVAEEREACAELAERGGCVVTADRIRARGVNAP